MPPGGVVAGVVGMEREELMTVSIANGAVPELEIMLG